MYIEQDHSSTGQMLTQDGGPKRVVVDYVDLPDITPPEDQITPLNDDERQRLDDSWKLAYAIGSTLVGRQFPTTRDMVEAMKDASGMEEDERFRETSKLLRREDYVNPPEEYRDTVTNELRYGMVLSSLGKQALENEIALIRQDQGSQA